MSQEKDWGKATLVSSQRIKACTRYYYIDAKLDSKGNKYIVLSETKLKESEGKLERHRIFIYEEDFAKVSEALRQTILEISDAALAGDEPTAAEADTTHAHHTEATTEGLHDEDLQLQSFDIEWTDEA